MNPHRPLRHSWLVLIVCLALPLVAGGLGGLVTAKNIPTWYVQLRKPPFNPPNWIFGPVWTALYLMMGFASYLVLRRGLDHPRVRQAITFYAIQLFLNAIWTPVFFGLHTLWLALAIVALLWVCILITALLFRPISRPAFWMMIPYLLWVSFATTLNAAIAWLNRSV